MRRVLIMAVAAGLLGACTSDAVTTPSPAPSAAIQTESASPTARLDPTAQAASATPSPMATPTPEAATPSPPEPSATLPGVGTANNVEGTRLAAGPDGVVFVSIPRRAGSVLAALGPTGTPMPGWPIEVPNSTACHGLFPMDDGSVRVLCDGTDLPKYEWCCDDERAFAFAPDARPLPGWPVQVPPVAAARTNGTDLVLVIDVGFTDSVTPGEPSHRGTVVRIDADGTRMDGDVVELDEGCCGEWVIGPLGAAYAASLEGGGYVIPAPGAEKTLVHALDGDGLRAGWPASLGGVGSRPAIHDNGTVLITLGATDEPGVRVRALDGRSGEPGVSSPRLPYPRPDPFGVDCAVPTPEPVIVGPDRRSFVWGGDDRVYGLSPDLKLREGWPVRLPGAIETPGISAGGLDCFRPVAPVAAPDGGLFVLLASAGVAGGRALAIGPGGDIRPGWPVELRRPGSAFWRLDVDEAGIAYALAVEPEGRRWSATILAIEPDSTIRYRTTVLEP